ncbi:uncharacterized protein [Palaemon carinicauda]|uniref:uncharacterized protein isoform X2 n=1 Tax=Palaemon carinicauda TaxID=392227 RepID=UPI0035B59CA3
MIFVLALVVCGVFCDYHSPDGEEPQIFVLALVVCGVFCDYHSPDGEEPQLCVLIVTLHAIAADTSFPSRPTRQTPIDVEHQILNLPAPSFHPLLPPIQSEDQPSDLNLHSVKLPPSNFDITGPLVSSLGTVTPNPFELSHQGFNTPLTSGHTDLPGPQSSTLPLARSLGTVTPNPFELPNQGFNTPPTSGHVDFLGPQSSTLPNPGPTQLTPVFLGSPSLLQAENRIFGLDSLFPISLLPMNLGPGGPIALFPNKVPSSGDSTSVSFPTTDLVTSILTFSPKFPPFLGNKNKKGSFRTSVPLPTISKQSIGNTGGMFSSAYPSTFISALAPAPVPAPAPSPAYVYPLPDKIFTEPQYDFHYAVNNEHSRNKFAHQETRRGQDTHGHYEVLLPDGRLQRVGYSVQGDGGYVAHVTYENP